MERLPSRIVFYSRKTISDQVGRFIFVLKLASVDISLVWRDQWNRQWTNDRYAQCQLAFSIKPFQWCGWCELPEKMRSEMIGVAKMKRRFLLSTAHGWRRRKGWLDCGGGWQRPRAPSGSARAPLPDWLEEFLHTHAQRHKKSLSTHNPLKTDFYWRIQYICMIIAQ